MTDPQHPNRRQWLQRTSAWLGAPALAGLTGCATAPAFETPPATVTVAPLRDGQVLRFQLTDLYSARGLGEATMTVQPSRSRARHLAVSLPASNVFRDDSRPARTGQTVWTDGQVSEELFFDVPCRFSQPDPLLPEGLALGRGPLLGNTCQRADDDRPRRWVTQLTGEGWERVEVPAGRFLALRVHRSIWFDHPDPWRRDNTRSERLWFAPALGFWVRREWTGEYLVPDVRRDVRREDWVRFELA